MKQAGERELFEFLLDIDGRLGGQILEGRITLYIFGGAAAAIAYGSPRATVDIDAYLEDERIEKKLLEWAGTLSLTVAELEMKTDCLIGPPGCEPLVGQLVMEALDLICDPVRRTLTPRPESPFLPTLKMKQSGASEFRPILSRCPLPPQISPRTPRR